jgi:hypothetical protein
MPAKKTTTAKKVAAAPKKTAAKKPAAKKEEVKAAPAAVKPVAEKAAVKKTAEKKTAVKKTAEKKAPAKRAARKTAAKPAAKKAAAPAVEKKDVQYYIDKINWKKGEANGMDWLYIEISAEGLLTEFEAGVDNIETVCKAMLETMLEGDTFINATSAADHIDRELKVRYYCDNLSPERKKYFSK